MKYQTTRFRVSKVAGQVTEELRIDADTLRLIVAAGLLSLGMDVASDDVHFEVSQPDECEMFAVAELEGVSIHKSTFFPLCQQGEKVS